MISLKRKIFSLRPLFLQITVEYEHLVHCQTFIDLSHWIFPFYKLCFETINTDEIIVIIQNSACCTEIIVICSNKIKRFYGTLGLQISG